MTLRREATLKLSRLSKIEELLKSSIKQIYPKDLLPSMNLKINMENSHQCLSLIRDQKWISMSGITRVVCLKVRYYNGNKKEGETLNLRIDTIGPN